jgi:prepilin-type N-terminal cleavage/methylation domain-containing protein
MVREVNGFSLIELLIVIVILSILMGLYFGPVRSQLMKSKLSESVNKLIADLNSAKRRAITEAIPYGVRVVENPPSYIIFADKNKDCKENSGELVREVKLPRGITISANEETIVWTRKGIPLNGTCGFYSGRIRLKAMDFSKEIVIGRMGRIRIE